MATRLRKLRLTRVDTVTAGANVDPLTGEGAKILLYKSAPSAPVTPNGGAPMPTEDEQLAELRKAIDDAAAAAVAEAMAPVRKQLDDQTAKYEAEKAEFEAAVKAAEDDPERIDKAALPLAVRKALDAAEATARAASERVAKMEEEQAVTRWTAVAKGLPHVAVAKALGGDAVADLASLLHSIEKDAGVAVAEQVTEVLAAAEARVSESPLLEEVGAGGTTGPLSDADTALDQAAERLRAEDPSLTRAAAITKAALANPALASRALQEVHGA